MTLYSNAVIMAVRTPKQVIDQAVAENLFGERLLYGMASMFGVVGLAVLVWAAINRMPLIAAVGTIASALFWPAIASARQTRKESIAIRLLEAPLSRADTANDASDMLRVFFRELMLNKGTDGNTKAKAASRE